MESRWRPVSKSNHIKLHFPPRTATAMARVQISGYRAVLNKVAMTKAIRECAGLSLADAKLHTDSLLTGVPTVLELPTKEIADRLIEELTQCGAIAEPEE
jgi:ribosomal protein L7/L12